MKKKDLKDLNDRLPELKKMFNVLLKENGFPTANIDSVQFSFLCDSKGKCPPGYKPTPVFNSETQDFDCHCKLL